MLLIIGAYQAMAQDSAGGDEVISADCISSAPAGWVTYIIQANDTLSGIAARSGSDVQELARVNCITDRRLIMIAVKMREAGAEVAITEVFKCLK
jgi:hypothetical protein